LSGVFSLIHYHGTPITPRSKLLEMQGRHFCVSFADPRDLETCLRIGQSLMMDNGAFTAYTKGKPMDKPGFYDWCEEYLCHPNWAVIPDVIGGSVEDQRESMKDWPFPSELSAPVWHLNLSFEWLQELADRFGRVCLGSSGEFWQIGTRKWEQRMDQVFEVLSRKRFLPWVHGMRMLGQSDGRWPLASADSSNIARHHAELKVSPEVMANRIDAVQPQRKWKPSPQQELI
jgi:hypothetical protein